MKHLLPALPYDTAALEPHIDARTMALHHGKHHAGYVAQLNATVDLFPELEGRSAAWLLLNPGKLPEDARHAVRDCAGGHVNHSLFWRAMSAKGGGAPTGHLADAIARNFGSFETFKMRFEDAAAGVLGSGWCGSHARSRMAGCYACSRPPGITTRCCRGIFRSWSNDLWEHAYYLKHENRRDEYLKDWWAVVNWEEAGRRFERSGHSAVNRWAAEGELLLEPA
jgi:Fe-Mn family superoxide dismutase